MQGSGSTRLFVVVILGTLSVLGYYSWSGWNDQKQYREDCQIAPVHLEQQKAEIDGESVLLIQIWKKVRGEWIQIAPRSDRPTTVHWAEDLHMDKVVRDLRLQGWHLTVDFVPLRNAPEWIIARRVN